MKMRKMAETTIKGASCGDYWSQEAPSFPFFLCGDDSVMFIKTSNQETYHLFEVVKNLGVSLSTKK